MPFPLRKRPSVPWHDMKGSRDTYFGAPRTEINPKTGLPYPTHGACDLIAPFNSEVLAVASGTVWYFGGFYDAYGKMLDKDGNKILDKDGKDMPCVEHLNELAIIHEDDPDLGSFIARYCEISPILPAKTAKGTGVQVDPGDVIAYVGPNCHVKGEQMLHFEMFSDATRRDPLTVSPSPKQYRYVEWRDYWRRDDLLDPTIYLDFWAMQLLQQETRKYAGRHVREVR